MFLNHETFAKVVASTPLFAIDLIIVNEHQELLLGKRINRPAQNFWFVPGGRVYKNEPLAKAFSRLTESEIGIALDYTKGTLLGVFEHFYQDSIFGDDIDTHYINAAHALILSSDELSSLPIGKQHAQYIWKKITDIDTDPDIHVYTKNYLPYLNKVLVD